MSSIQNRIDAFVALGNFLSQFSSNKIEKSSTVPFNDLFFDGFIHQIKLAEENAGESINDLTDDHKIDRLTGNANFSGTRVKVRL